jgi:two-component system, OmpR family, phosphate regulon response regulator PhoB
MTKPRLLVVEDDPALAALISYNLEAEGYDVEVVERGDLAELRLKELPPDLVVLDWMLPGLSGIELVRRMRLQKALKAVPVLMLTARGEESDRIRGLKDGADDYVVKPFSVPEFMARVQALLRRSKPEIASDVLVRGSIHLDRGRKRVMRDAVEVHLGPTEFRLLEWLMRHPGRVYNRSQLLDHVWGESAEIDDRTVDVHVGRLRKALQGTAGAPNPIRTVRGLGYAFDETFR